MNEGKDETNVIHASNIEQNLIEELLICSLILIISAQTVRLSETYLKTQSIWLKIKWQQDILLQHT